MFNKKYNKNQEISVAVDCVIFGYDEQKLNLLLFKRKYKPFKGDWSLLGDAPDGKLSMDQSAQDIIFNLTGAKDIYLNQLKTYGDVNRDPRDRVVSIVYFSLIRVDYFNIIDLEKHNVKWFDLYNIPEIVLDHNQMVNDAFNEIKRYCKNTACRI
jgi:ADP-ribose pyrophosphatase YjhB (NUDIX family)